MHLGARACVPLAVLLTACAAGPSDATRDEDARRRARLDRTSVHFHLALRAAAEQDEGFAARWLAARGEPARAAALADEVYGDVARGRDWLDADRRARRPMLRGVVDEPAAAETERAGFFLALLLEVAGSDRRIPKQILVYEAERLSLEAVDDPALRTLAQAGRALIMARAGYCDSTEADAAAVLSRVGDDATLAPATAIGVDAEVLAVDLARAARALARGARACCAIRQERDAAAAEIAERMLVDAEGLEFERPRVVVVRAWSAVARGEPEAARAHLGEISPADLDPEDRPRYALVRETLAAGAASEGDAQARLMDRQWMSHMVLVGVSRALARDGLVDALASRPVPGALLRLAEAEADLVAAARERHPLFDQAHEVEGGFLDRIAALFD